MVLKMLYYIIYSRYVCIYLPRRVRSIDVKGVELGLKKA